MKKLLTLALAAVLALSLVACGGTAASRTAHIPPSTRNRPMIGRSICPSLIRTA